LPLVASASPARSRESSRLRTTSGWKTGKIRSKICTEISKIKTMKQVSLKDLKEGLSRAVAEAEAGHTIVVTRHNRPVAHLGPVTHEDVRRGASVGRGGIRPAVKRGTSGRYLAVLLEDRSAR
jgi:prevent-host-death family protein